MNITGSLFNINIKLLLINNNIIIIYKKQIHLYRVHKQKWQKILKDSSDVIFEPTKMPLVSFKRCIQVES
jgi:hypothetical protein